MLAMFCYALGAGRIIIGLAPFAFPNQAISLLGFPKEHDNETARVMGRLFGVRDIGLGILVIAALQMPKTLPFVFLFNAATDMGDVLSFAIAIRKDPKLKSGSVRSMLIASTAVALWMFGFFFLLPKI